MTDAKLAAPAAIAQSCTACSQRAPASPWDVMSPHLCCRPYPLSSKQSISCSRRPCPLRPKRCTCGARCGGLSIAFPPICLADSVCLVVCARVPLLLGWWVALAVVWCACSVDLVGCSVMELRAEEWRKGRWSGVEEVDFRLVDLSCVSCVLGSSSPFVQGPPAPRLSSLLLLPARKRMLATAPPPWRVRPRDCALLGFECHILKPFVSRRGRD